MKITHCKLKKSVQKKLLEFFVLEVTARSAADILQINPNSAALFYKKVRQVIEYHLLQEADEILASPKFRLDDFVIFFDKLRLSKVDISYQLNLIFSGLIALDESYFGGVRKGKRGRGAAGKVAVFGILKRQGKVYTVVVDDTKTNTLTPVIKRKIMPDSIVYTDCYRSYNALDVSEFHHYRINHSTHFAEQKNHINGIENDFLRAKRS